ncbi:MAG: hypothetical protein ACI4BH_07485 [Muribaculaceae bacterium]
MKFRESVINDFFNSKAFAILAAIALTVMMYVNYTSGNVITAFTHGHGILFPSLSGSIYDPCISVVLNAFCIILIGLTMVILNKMFNFIRSVTWIYVSTFLLLTFSSPITSSSLFTGTLVGIVIVLTMFTLYASFQNKRSQRNIFSSFALVSAASMFHYAFIYLIPVLMLGYMLMQAMNLRSFLAMLLGIITPFWIVLGLGIADLADFSLPSYESAWAALRTPQLHLSIVYIAIIIIITVVLTCINLLQIINYKLQARAYNGYLVYLSVASILMMAIDYQNAFIYLPAVNLCFGVQFAHFFTLNSHTRRYIAVIVLIVATIAGNILQVTL